MTAYEIYSTYENKKNSIIEKLKSRHIFRDNYSRQFYQDELIDALKREYDNHINQYVHKNIEKFPRAINETELKLLKLSSKTKWILNENRIYYDNIEIGSYIC